MYAYRLNQIPNKIYNLMDLADYTVAQLIFDA
jgi:hypothetical protein